MLEMILKMSGITLLYVLLTWVLWRSVKGKNIEWDTYLGIGIIYGFTAILSTHFGVDYGDMILNVRDLGPMIAGLFFHPVAGITAGLIGGFERYIVGAHFGVGSFTTVACSISTCFAGFFAAFMNKHIFNGKKPSVAYAFFLGAVIEVFHMYVVFISHRSNMEMAFKVVKTCSVPMIVFSAIGLAAVAEMVRYLSGEKRVRWLEVSDEETPVSHKFQTWLFIVTMVVLIVSFLFNFNLQSMSARQEGEAKLKLDSQDIAEDFYQIRKYDADFSYLNEHVGSKGAFDVFNKSGEIVTGSHTGKGEDKQLFDMHNSTRYGIIYRQTYENEKWTCLNTDLGDGYSLMVMTPDSEMYQYRDRLAYETILADILLFTVIYILVSLLVQMIVVDNLKLVNQSLAKITDGDFNEQVSVYESSEFASLSNDINEMVTALKGYIDAAEKRIEQELLLARTIQASALPDNFDFVHGGFEIYATMEPAKKVGGDFYDFFFAGPEKLAIVIADVSDKGIPAALFMMQSKTAIRSLAETGSEITEIFEKVNNELCEGNEAEMFVTVWMAFVNLVTGEVECVNAGHEYPAVMSGDGQYKLLKDKHGLPLGCIEGMTYSSYKLKLEVGDCIYVYTDGIAEAINTSEEQFGTDRMLDVLNQNKDAKMTEVLSAVKTAVDEFAGEAEQFDDQPMVGFRYTGLPEKTKTEA